MISTTVVSSISDAALLTEESGSAVRLKGPVLPGYYDIDTTHRSGHRGCETHQLQAYHFFKLFQTGQMGCNLENNLWSPQEDTSGLEIQQ